MSLFPSLIVKNLKQSLQQIHGCQDVPFWVLNSPSSPNNTFLEKKKVNIFSSTYWPSSLSKIFKKILGANPELWGCAIYEPKMTHLPKQEFFFFTNLLMKVVPFI